MTKNEKLLFEALEQLLSSVENKTVTVGDCNQARNALNIKSPTKLFIDCEFNGFNGSLISLALVDPAGPEFYQVLPCDNPVPWVRDNVMPILFNPAIEIDGFRKALAAWLRRYDSVVIIADHPADIKYFADVIISDDRGGWLSLPPIAFEIRPELSNSNSVVPHNALEDARANAIQAKTLRLS